MGKEEQTYTGNEIAVVGMSGEFPKCKDVDTFWEAIVSGKNCITIYSKDELEEAGINPQLLNNEQYIRAKGELPDIEIFDAAFFNISPQEAELMDPQHRLLLQCAWSALENAGLNTDNYAGTVGVYAGKSLSSYLYLNIFPNLQKTMAMGNLQAAIGNDKDSLTTTIAYHLNLKGPAVTTQSSSSTSLVSLCMACQALLTYQCDAALAGGITAGPPARGGYLYEEGGIYSNTGQGLSFNEGSTGFVPGNGYGLVVLKRLEDAIQEGDKIWAVVKGFAVNNDGADKISYTAPSARAHAEVVTLAQTMADVEPESIEYLEAHGTGTQMGDPIEIEALTKAFRNATDKNKFCALGSVKANIGHLDSAAGIAGFIKTVLTVNHGVIPPLAGFTKLNPQISLDQSPFYISTQAKPWKTVKGMRRAGVSSLGMGGTNAHVIVEQAPITQDSDDAIKPRIILLSGKTIYSLEENKSRLKNYLAAHPAEKLADVAYTLALGRKSFLYRFTAVGSSLETIIEQLESVKTVAECSTNNRKCVFMFPGQGTQYPHMMRALYNNYPDFRQVYDQCSEYIIEFSGIDIRAYMQEEQLDEDTFMNTRIAQPVLFTCGYCLAMLYQSLGIKPAAMIGHSLGEYIAAAVASVFSLRDALYLVCERARLMSQAKPGAMLSVAVSAEQIWDITRADVSIAANNTPAHCVVSGAIEEIEKVKTDCQKQNTFCRELKTSHAFHSKMMKEAAQAFKERLETVVFKKPQIPYISGVDGTWADHLTSSADYWEKHMMEPVNFAAGVSTLLNTDDYVFLEVGAGKTLSTLAGYQIASEKKGCFISSVRSEKELIGDEEFFMDSLARLWSNGVDINWEAVFKHEQRKKTWLPGYAFDGASFWIDAQKEQELYIRQECQGANPNDSREEELKIKLDKVRHYHQRPHLSHAYAEAETETEKVLVHMLEDLLKIQPVGITDSFFELGGQSLLAAQLLANINDYFSIHINMNSIFENDTAKKLSGQIEALAKNSLKESSLEELYAEVLEMDEK